MKYTEFLEYVDSLKNYGIVPGLDNIRRLCNALGNPQDSLRFIHIAGTNGKGSVLAYLSTILKCAGYKVGRYLSPVIFDYRERIQTGGRPITQAACCEGMEIIRDICAQMKAEGFPHPTPFEAETALAFWYFQKTGCEYVVLETGMGGLEDATNLITTTVAAVITPISMDHMAFLGNTLSQIAAQKAGIIKKGSVVISICQQQEVMQVIENTAAAHGCSLEVADPQQVYRIRYGVERQRFDYGGFQNLEITMAGRFQIENAALAVETVKVLTQSGLKIPESALRKGLCETKWPGRFSVIGRRPLFIADGAHNEDAAIKLAESIDFYFTNKRIIYIMGVLKDKEYGRIIEVTYRYADQIITVTPPENPRAMQAYDLAGEVAKVHPRVTAADSLEEAVEMSCLLAGREDVIIAFGSLSYLGRLIRIVTKRTQDRQKKGSGAK